VGVPPLEADPLKDNAVDYSHLAEKFVEAIGWDKESMMPDKDSLDDRGVPLDMQKNATDSTDLKN
jgi:hypothetical protein